MGIANDTIVVYTSDNGPHMNTWPDGAMTCFRSEKNTNWEGAFRVPCLVRWPGVIQPGTVTNELMSHNDWIPTLCAVAGEPDIVNKLRQGYLANGINYKVHLDGYSQLEFLRSVSGSAANNNGMKSARDTFFYSDDNGLLVGMRKGDWKYVFSEQRKEGTMAVWAEPFTTLRLQKIYNLFQDPFELPTSRPIPIGIGSSTRSAASTASWTTSSSSWGRSRNIHRARSRRASIRRISWKARLRA